MKIFVIAVFVIGALVRIYLGYDQYRMLSPNQKEEMWKKHGLMIWTKF